MSPTRNQSNRALPKYWRLKNGSYSYRVPAHMRHLHDGKAEISLGQSLSKAYQTFAGLYQTEECITLMRELFDRYSAEVVPEKAIATQRANHASLGRLRASMGHNLVTTATSQVIYRYRDIIHRKHGKKTANLDLEVLSHCFTKAIEWGITAQHPMTEKKVVKFALPARERYVEDWELEEWCKVAPPFLLAYASLKGVTGLRKQDMLTIKLSDISDTELTSVNLKTGKKIRFPLYDTNGQPSTVQFAIEDVLDYYRGLRAGKRTTALSQYLFHNRRGECYWSAETATCSGFNSIWGRAMDKALKETKLQARFTDHDLRSKVASDLDTDQEASALLAHSSIQITRKHYRLKGTKMVPAKGFFHNK